MYESVRRQLSATLGAIRDQGLHKGERVLTTPQRARISVAGGAQVINLCANNYLGLAEHPEVIRAAHEGLDRWGYGLSSVRFICGTQAIHKELEASLSKF
ncbi:MAG: aminotransferase class I/II-fold pyridoxal phosphate-dependent enzyme, partial [Rhodospirillaceae bacterium]|nr:aminotransferase class I/II-fold pyridoxal phosphate-dependent enzyme [Rhodospirillaceae bacterium]